MSQALTHSCDRALEGRAILGSSPSVVEVRRRLLRYAGCDVPLVISGEPGTGKTLLALAVHQQSGRDSLRVIQGRELREGHEPTLAHLRSPQPCGAEGPRPHRSRSRTTTLLVEDLEDAPELSRRRIHTGIRRVCGLPGRPGRGDSHPPRLLVTTRLEPGLDRLPDALELGSHALRLHLQPLRSRPADIPVIATRELADLARETGRIGACLDPGALRVLAAHRWPDNVRELLFVIRHMVATRPDARVYDRFDVNEALDTLRNDFTPRAHFEVRERTRLRTALDENQWNVSATARSLGRSRGWLRRRISALELD